jgi:hypothetical protein
MSRSVLPVRLVFAAVGLLYLASVPPLAMAHEGEEHAMHCNEAGMNEMKTDIQAMPDGEAKTNAMKEMHMAGEMMSKEDMQGCKDHMHKAMEIMEK